MVHTLPIQMAMPSQEVKTMSTSMVVEVDLDVYRVEEDKLVIMDKAKNYLFIFKKSKRGLTLNIGVRGKPSLKCRLGKAQGNENDLGNLGERIRRCLLRVDDPGIQGALDQFTATLLRLYEDWETRLEDLETAKEMEEIWREAPKLAVQTSTGTIEILESDGYTVSLRGGVVPPPLGLDNKSFAVIETIYVLAKKPVLTRKGSLVEIKTVMPLFIIAEYKEGKLQLPLRIEDPEAGVIKVLSSVPVRVEAKSRAKDSLPTLLDLDAVRPWIEGESREPPSFRDVYNEILGSLKRYVCYSWDERLYHLNASYILYTYFHDFFTVAPRLFFLGPYGTGKTRAMLTTVSMSWHGYAVLDPSEASTYRSIEAFGLTLGIDESALPNRLEKIIAAGYKRGTKVPRVDKAAKESFVLSFFDVFAPVVLAFTEPPNELLAQRAIVVNMEKCEDPNPSREDPSYAEFKDLRNRLYALRLLRANEFVAAMEKVRELVKDVLKGRDFEIWYPVLVAAYLGGEEAFCSVLGLALEDVAQRRASLYTEEKLVLRGIEALLSEQDMDEIVFMASDLMEKIHNILVNEEGYTEKQAQRAWPVTKVGRVLRRLGFRRESTRTDQGPRKVYRVSRKRLEELKAKYGIIDVKEEVKRKLKEFKCSQCSHCSRFSEEVESGGTPLQRDNSVVGSDVGAAGTDLSEKLTTLTTVTTLEQFLERANISEQRRRLGVLDAIIKIVHEEKKTTDIDIYRKLVEMEKAGLLVEGILVSWEKLTEWLRILEDQGKVARVYDERDGREYYVPP